MSVQEKVKQNINSMEKGIIFNYADLDAFQTESASAVTKAISRLVERGEIKRFSTGKFYCPKSGLLGEQPLSDSEKLKTFLYKNGNRNGYITDIALFNRLGLTTQIPLTYVIAANQVLNKKDLGSFKLSVIKAKAPVTENNIQYLEVLDVLDSIKSIPDNDPFNTFTIILALISGVESIDQLTDFAINYYSPSVNALLGFYLSNLNQNTAKDNIIKLKQSLNPLTVYRLNLGLSDHQYTNKASDWNIK